jgi:hypothetical protein
LVAGWTARAKSLDLAVKVVEEIRAAGGIAVGNR